MPEHQKRTLQDRPIRAPGPGARSFLLGLLLALLMGGCVSPAPEAPQERHEFVRAAMGTQFRISLYAENSTQARAAADKAFERIDRLEEIMSDYQADSELSLLREHPPGTPIKVSADLFEVLTQAETVSRATEGVFDVTLGPFTRLWRFSRKRKALPSEGELREARQAVGFEKLRLDPTNRTVALTVPGMRLDVGGIAKGYAADAALSELKALGLNRALVAASGDIAAGEAPPGKKGWTVAISAPGGKDSEPLRTLTIRNAGVSTSGDTEQSIEIDGRRYSHILDSRTGLGLTNRVQATVVAPNATLSDPLATAVRTLGPERGLAMLKKFSPVSGLVVTIEPGVTNVHTTRKFGR